MSRRKAKFRLEDLDANEVSLVPKGANNRPFSILKMDDSVDKQERPSKSEGGKKFFASDYAYVPDRNKPSTWKLRLTNTPGGEPDPRIVGAAVAALGKGFRGQKVQIPSADLPGVKSKVRAAWLKANPDKKREDLPQVIKEDSVSKDDNALFEEEILKAELEEVLEQPVDGEEEIVSELVEKQSLSSRAASAFRGAMRIFKGFQDELPSNFMELLNPVVGEVNEEEQEEKDMADQVTKANQDEEALKAKADAADASDDASEEEEEVTKAKKQEEEEEEEENGKKKKLPPFLRRKKKSATAKEDGEEGGEITLEDLPEEYQEIFKSYEGIRKENAEIKKLQEETRQELEAEKDARATEQAIQKAAEDYPNLPVKPEELGPIVKKVKETLSNEEVETFERVLKAADEAVKARKDFEEATSGSYAYSEGGNSHSKLKEIAKSLVEKSEKPMTDAQAYALAVNQNPQLYDEYLAEQRG